MSEKHITVKEVTLNNNCPECYNNKGLILSFQQQFIETRFYKSITAKVNHKLACKVCNTTIYPVQWNEDIERVVAYQEKAFTPKNPSTYLKKISWVIIIIVLVLALSLTILVFYPK